MCLSAFLSVFLLLTASLCFDRKRPPSAATATLTTTITTTKVTAAAMKLESRASTMLHLLSFYIHTHTHIHTYVHTIATRSWLVVFSLHIKSTCPSALCSVIDGTIIWFEEDGWWRVDEWKKEISLEGWHREERTIVMVILAIIRLPPARMCRPIHATTNKVDRLVGFFKRRYCVTLILINGMDNRSSIPRPVSVRQTVLNMEGQGRWLGVDSRVCVCVCVF